MQTSSGKHLQHGQDAAVARSGKLKPYEFGGLQGNLRLDKGFTVSAQPGTWLRWWCAASLQIMWHQLVAVAQHCQLARSAQR